MSAEWFCKVGDKQVGPLSGSQLKAMVAKGKLKPEHPIRKGTEGPWVPAGRVKGLFPAGGEAAEGAEKKPAAQKPVAKKPAAPKTAKPIILPTADVAPAPPGDLPDEMVPVAHAGKKHHGFNVDNLIQSHAAPVKVTGGHKRGLAAGLKKEEQKKATMILLGVIGGGMLIAVIVFGIAFSKGLLSSPEKESAKKDEATQEEGDAAKKEAADKAKAEKEAEKTKSEKGGDDEWPDGTEFVDFKGISLKVKNATRGEPSGEIGANEDEVLSLTLLVRADEKKVDFEGWTSSIKKIVLMDDAGKSYAALGVEEKDAPKAVDPKAKAFPVQVVFKTPPKKSKFLKLGMPGSAFGGTGLMRMQFETDMIKAAEPKPKADKDTAAKPTPDKDAGEKPAAEKAKPDKAASGKKPAEEDEIKIDAPGGK